MPDARTEYRRLRDRVNARVAEVIEAHGPAITCHAGCSRCCTELTVFPVEYQAILDELKERGVTELPFEADAACSFLKDHLCVIYEHRPMICRTHGLPVAFVNDDASGAGGGGADAGPEVSVSFCPLNFTDEGVELDFGPENTLDMDALNTELLQVNMRFLLEEPSGRVDPTRRIPLRQLRRDLRAGETAGGASSGSK